MTRRVALLAALAALAASCSAPYTPEGIYGYKVRRDHVRFEFRPRRYPWTVYAATGDSVALRDLRVRRVALEVVYEDGATRRFRLKRSEGSWEARLERRRFEERRPRAFSFVVNDRFVALPPRAATNRTGAAPVRLALEVPGRGGEER